MEVWGATDDVWGAGAVAVWVWLDLGAAVAFTTILAVAVTFPNALTAVIAKV